MSGTLAGADVRGFYRALGIELPAWTLPEASVACFADPDAHAHGDRDPSCSVNVRRAHGAAGGAAPKAARLTRRAHAAWTPARRSS